MIKIPKRMVKQWCNIKGQPGYLLTTGVKVLQSAVEFEEIECLKCKKQFLDKREGKRHEAYIKRFGLCLYCHSKELFPNNEDKQNSYRLTMLCNSAVGACGAEYNVDYMLQTCVKI